jgi:hypothetical protein
LWASKGPPAATAETSFVVTDRNTGKEISWASLSDADKYEVTRIAQSEGVLSAQAGQKLEGKVLKSGKLPIEDIGKLASQGKFDEALKQLQALRVRRFRKYVEDYHPERTTSKELDIMEQEYIQELDMIESMVARIKAMRDAGAPSRLTPVERDAAFDKEMQERFKDSPANRHLWNRIDKMSEEEVITELEKLGAYNRANGWFEPLERPRIPMLPAELEDRLAILTYRIRQIEADKYWEENPAQVTPEMLEDIERGMSEEAAESAGIRPGSAR